MRALRRHHRERVIRKRERVARATAVIPGDYQGKHPRGALADNQYWCGCNTPNCGLCHPWKRWGSARDRSWEAVA
jgi:hypothetical protein